MPKINFSIKSKPLTSSNRKRKKDKKDKFVVTPPKKRNYKLLLLPFFLFLILLCVFAVIRDNNRIRINSVSIYNEQIPDSFNGYRILQISDILGKSFGDSNKKLTDAIDSVDYDMILLTGDYVYEGHDADIWDLTDALKARKNKNAPVYYILGDNDCSDKSLGDRCIEPSVKNDIMNTLDNSGAIFIYPIQQISKDGQSIFLTGIKYYEKIFDALNFDTDKCFSILVSHAPIDYDVDKRLEKINSSALTEVDYDLSISGHTLGGQYRLPFLGALYVKGKGLFPQEKYAAGLNVTKNRSDFISSGLGSLGLLDFRLCNTPEIALITLTNKQQ